MDRWNATASTTRLDATARNVNRSSSIDRGREQQRGMPTSAKVRVGGLWKFCSCCWFVAGRVEIYFSFARFVVQIQPFSYVHMQSVSRNEFFISIFASSNYRRSRSLFHLISSGNIFFSCFRSRLTLKVNPHRREKASDTHTFDFNDGYDKVVCYLEHVVEWKMFFTFFPTDWALSDSQKGGRKLSLTAERRAQVL